MSKWETSFRCGECGLLVYEHDDVRYNIDGSNHQCEGETG